MNENIDLTKILEGCPEGTEFYSSLFGEVEFVGTSDGRIIVDCVRINRRFMFNAAGKYEMSELRYSDDWGNHLHSDECLLFPSKGQRNWSKFERFWDKPKVERFDPKTWKVLDKVLFRLEAERPWRYSLFRRMVSDYFDKEVVATTDGLSLFCIPYNDDTKHLLDTKDDCPEYYKWWKDRI